MDLTLIGGGLVVVAILVGVVIMRRPTRLPAAAALAPQRPLEGPTAAEGIPPTSSARAAGAAVDTTPAPLLRPTPLGNFHLRTTADLSDEERARMLDRLSGLQRPSGTLQQLLSPAMIEAASSAELAELIQGEPLLAAKVLATVNSAAYGLQRTVASIGQAITLLGLASVRRMALEQLLRQTLRASDPLRQSLCDARWRASLVGTELCYQLAQRLALPDYGALSTQAVLASVGHYAMLSLREPAALQASAAMDPVSRCADEQREVGLAAPALGALLLKSWALPQDLVNEVAAIETVMVTPAPPGAALKPGATSRAAVACLCLRLGEQLATIGPEALQTWSLQAQVGPEWFHLRQHLAAPAFDRVDDLLRAPEMQAAIWQQMTVE